MFLSLMRDVILLVPGVCLLGLLGDLYTMLWAGPVADIGSFIVTVLFVFIECKKIRELDGYSPVMKKSNNHFVISLGREFGSGGKYIGEELSKRFGIKCYDKEILKKVAKDYHIDMKTLESVSEKQKSSFWYSFATNYVFDKKRVTPVSASDDLFLKQAKVIEELASLEDCVIIGRCSDYILKGKENVIRLFVYASDKSFKIERKKEFENLSEKEAMKKIEKIDKERSEYYEYYTSQKWGDKSNYELCIDTSIVGVEKTIDLLEQYIKNRINKM